MRFIFSFLLITSFPVLLRAQFTVSGTVLDISKTSYVENVRVVSSGGVFSITDSVGKYSILVAEKDSLTFYYNNKPTQKFAVATIQDPLHFDISLRIPVKGRVKVLQEVTVFARSHREDSLENRGTYAEVFNYQRPGIQSSISPDGVAGANLDEIINIFRFRRNKRLRAFQERLEQQEQEKYVDYRFNRRYIQRITGLQSPQLDTFLVWYRPSYEFARICDELNFNQYILNSLYQYRDLMKSSPAKKEE